MDEEKPLNLIRAKGSQAVRAALASKQDPDQKRRGRTARAGMLKDHEENKSIAIDVPQQPVGVQDNKDTALPHNEDQKEYRRAWEDQAQPTITPTEQFTTTFSPKQMCAAVLESHKIGYDQGLKEALENIGIILGVNADDVIETLKQYQNIGGQSA